LRKPIPYGRQTITQKDIDAVVETLSSDFLTQGPKIAEFESAFAEYVGAKYAIAVSNGTAALHLSVMALDLQKGEQVITTPITFVASANCVKYQEGEIVFADIDPESYLIDLVAVEELLKKSEPGTFKGIIPVDFAGFPVNMEALRSLADKYKLWIIEDACHAPGGFFTDSKNNRQYCGNGEFADLTVFSFHPVKHIATGEGGMITTNSELLYNKLLMLRSHGITKDPQLLQQQDGPWYYEMQMLGFNYRLTDIQAALGISQLQEASGRLKRRIEIAGRYNTALENVPGILATPILDPGHAFHLYVIEVHDRSGLYNFLRSKNIFTQIHYIPAHLMPYYQDLGWKKGDLPVAEAYYENCISLPLFPGLTDEEQEYIIEAILEFYKTR